MGMCEVVFLMVSLGARVVVRTEKGSVVEFSQEDSKFVLQSSVNQQK